MLVVWLSTRRNTPGQGKDRVGLRLISMCVYPCMIFRHKCSLEPLLGSQATKGSSPESEGLDAIRQAVWGPVFASAIERSLSDPNDAERIKNVLPAGRQDRT